MGNIRYEKEMTCKCDTKNLAEIRKMIRNAATEFFGDSMIVGKVTLAVDEAVANVMEHAYTGMTEVGYVHVLVRVEDLDFIVKVIDEGKKFDTTSMTSIDIREAVKNGQKNGYGIYLIRQVMDEIHYNYVKNIKNELCMIKKIESATAEEAEEVD